MEKIARQQDEAASEPKQVQEEGKDMETVPANNGVVDADDIGPRMELEKTNAELQETIEQMREELAQKEEQSSVATEDPPKKSSKGRKNKTSSIESGLSPDFITPPALASALKERNERLEGKLQEMSEELGQAHELLEQKDQQITALKAQLFEFYQQAVMQQQGEIQGLQAQIQELSGEDEG